MSCDVLLFLEVKPATTVNSKDFSRSTRPGSSSITKLCLNRASVVVKSSVGIGPMEPDIG
jgi:hypothetical protein